MTNKFKKGDRIRRTDFDIGDVKQGGEYTVRDHGPGFVMIEGSDRLYNPSAFVLTEPHVFKAGDRFRFVRDNTDGGAPFGKKGDEFVIHRVNGKRVDFSHPRYSREVGAYIEDIEPVTKSASVDPEEVPAESLVKATFTLGRGEIEKVLKSHLESKLGITTGGFSIARLGGHEVTLEAEVISA
ncbi:hypothetical protein [Brucella sp. 2716]|uniref:hypothetical protein n=1 Tax=Brucella sp. 2716 TaxID=2975052 RepID=UPI00217D730C|nr:hypothetical protein [Brucella sp. 2716]UWF59788.1 hypothetical protein NYO66_04565 [Brucella sp. 2716]